MVFSSVEFLFAFLPAFLLSQALLPRRANLTFVAFCIVFYFAGEGFFLAVVLASLLINFGFGLAIDSAIEPRRRKIVVGVAIAANLALLIFFKYAAFLHDVAFGSVPTHWTKSIHLPLGISFFTFHAMSYVIDVYRKDAKAERSLTNLALYILMFPQLIAGPILRYAGIASQLSQRVVTSKHVYYGIGFFVIGLGQKVLIADTMAGLVDPLFKQWMTLSTEAAWLAVLSYAFQIYFDFGGYSNMAIGLAMMCAFDFPRNFNYPYTSQSITEFWRRWHMTLSSWFRDYLYIPLGGSRFGTWKTYRNLFAVFLLCGLWHGAAWTFVLWGTYHGLFLVIERIGLARLLQRLPAVLRHAYALLAVMIGWVLFRAVSLEQALGILRTMFVPPASKEMSVFEFLTGESIVTLVCAAILSTPTLVRLLGPIIALPQQRPWPENVKLRAYGAGSLLYIIVFGASAIKILTGSYSPFIYFRF